MARGTTWFKAKRDKLRRQLMNATPPRHGVLEADKPLNARHETIGAANVKRAALDAMVAEFKGAVTYCGCGPYSAPEGKRKARRETTTYGDGRRRTGPVVTWDVYDYAPDRCEIVRR